MVEENTYIQMKDRLFEQTLSKQITVNDGEEGFITIPIRNDTNAFLKGYGYTWYTGSTTQLSTGVMTFPVRGDQEGSLAMPVIYGNPYPITKGGNLQLKFVNGSGGSVTFTAKFYLLTDKLVDEASQGTELLIQTGTTGTASAVSIQNSAGTTSADVIARGDGKNALCVDTELNVTISNVKVGSTDQTATNATYLKTDTDGVVQVNLSGSVRTPTHTAPTIGATTTTALTSNANRKGAILINDSDEVMYLNLGAPAVMNTGIRLNANGGSYEMSLELGNLTTVQINAICTSGSKTMIVTEFV